MKIAPFPDSGTWILAANVTPQCDSDIAITHAQAAGHAFEKCWTGEGWAHTASAAQRFETSHEADDYLALNRARMDK